MIVVVITISQVLNYLEK